MTYIHIVSLNRFAVNGTLYTKIKGQCACLTRPFTVNWGFYIWHCSLIRNENRVRCKTFRQNDEHVIINDNKLMYDTLSINGVMNVYINKLKWKFV